MPNEFFIFLLYLFYGMAFFAIGVSITSRDTHASNLKIASTLWLLAMFAYSHAFHEWFELYENLPFSPFPEHYLAFVNVLKLALILGSFGFLFYFGIRLLVISFPHRRLWFYLLPVTTIVLLFVSVFPFFSYLTPAKHAILNELIRNFVGLPAAACSGFGLISYSRTVKHVSPKGAKNFYGAGLAFLVYGILTGLVPSGTTLLFVNIPIELVRGLTAFVILHFIMNALHIFDEERKLLIEERLTRFAKSEKLHALGKLAFGIAHEINNPLTNVSMNVELLKKDLVERQNDDRALRRFDTIERNLDRASKIARELLAFSSEREPEFIPTSVNDVIDSTLELLGAQRKSLQIEVAKGDVPQIKGVPWKLEEVFLNVLVNAMDASKETGSIQISTYFKDGAVIAQIKDHGKGISRENLPHVMDPFFTTKGPGHGTGLGLSICYGIMELHKGGLEIESQEGLGTTVTLRFPLKGNRE